MSLVCTRQSAASEVPVQSSMSGDESPCLKQVDETSYKHVQFRESMSKTMVNNTKNPSYVSSFDDLSSSNSPVLEEPSSLRSSTGLNFFELKVWDDDLLPAIKDLQISGEPYLGHELQACGYSINGTTSCNFEWICPLEDESVNYIDEAKQPNYLVTADDVDSYLAVEVQPLQDPEMHSNIEKPLHIGHASYKVSLATGFLDLEATLYIKREDYNIKCYNCDGAFRVPSFTCDGPLVGLWAALLVAWFTIR